MLLDLVLWSSMVALAPLALDLASRQVVAVARGLGSTLRGHEPDLGESFRIYPRFDLDRLHGDEVKPWRGTSRSRVPGGKLAILAESLEPDNDR
jgi:hypothetical protein